MPWHYKSPSAFPAYFLASLREAAFAPEIPVILASAPKRPAIESIAERFRWFRWCIRADTGVIPDLFLILETFDIRSQIKMDDVGYILSIIAKPTKLSELQRLNETLLADISPFIAVNQEENNQ